MRKTVRCRTAGASWRRIRERIPAAINISSVVNPMPPPPLLGCGGGGCVGVTWVVACAAADSADVLPAASKASTVYVYVVFAASPRSVKVVPVGAAISTPSRRTE